MKVTFFPLNLADIVVGTSDFIELYLEKSNEAEFIEDEQLAQLLKAF